MTITSPNPNEALLTLAGLSRFERVFELVDAIQRLSLARTLEEIQEIVRTSARRLTGADGATFVLREGSQCYYADEDAISPLWKGQRFPLETCISGWAMLNREAAVIEDIYEDERIPHDAYRPTFVNSLAVVPIRTLDPVGAIGNYWATKHRPADEELELLRALADSTAVAMENVRVYQELERRIADRTAELLEKHDHHLEVLHTLAHEVRNSLAVARACLMVGVRRSVDGARAPLLDAETAVGQALDVVNRQLEAARLEAGAVEVNLVDVDLAQELPMLRPLFRAFVTNDGVELLVEAPEEPIALRTDPVLLGHILRNLVANALKFTDAGKVCVSAAPLADGDVAVSVSDTGIGMTRRTQNGSSPTGSRSPTRSPDGRRARAWGSRSCAGSWTRWAVTSSSRATAVGARRSRSCSRASLSKPPPFGPLEGPRWWCHSGTLRKRRGDSDCGELLSPPNVRSTKTSRVLRAP